MTHYRKMTQSDIVCPEHEAEDITPSTVESVQVCVVDGDPYVIVELVKIVGEGSSRCTVSIKVRLSAVEAKELGFHLVETSNFLKSAASQYVEQPF